MNKEQKIEDCEADCDCAEDMKAEEEINKILIARCKATERNIRDYIS
jgi:hypothetical protein